MTDKNEIINLIKKQTLKLINETFSDEKIEENFKEQINTNLFRNIKKPIYFFGFESLVTDSIYIFKFRINMNRC
jgi:hypothetical protein